MDVGRDETKCLLLVGPKSEGNKDDNYSEVENKPYQRNSLDIPEILSIVAGYIIKIEDLKKVRLLNRKWKEETFKKWRNTAVFLMNSETKPILLKALDKVGYYGLSDEEKEKLQATRDPFLLLKFPFKNYRLQSENSPRCAHHLEDTIMKEVIVPNADYLDIGQCVISRGRLERDDQLEDVLRHKLNVREFALAPLRKKGPANNNWNEYLPFEPTKALNLRKLILSVPTQKKSINTVPFFQEYLETAYLNFIRRMPSLKALHEINGNGTYNILSAMMQAARRNEIVIKLEDITVMTTPAPFLSYQIAEYFRVVRPPLRILKVPVYWIDCVQESNFIQSLRVVQDTLTELELAIDCAGELSRDLETPIQGDAGFYLNGRQFPNMTHFKVNLAVGSNGRLLSLDLNHLRKMPKIKEFFFGFKNPNVVPERVVRIKIRISEKAPIWINEENRFTPENAVLPKGIQFDPVLNDEVDGDGLKDLKSFHFHRNLTKESLQLLGKWARNLQTLETVLDKENFSAVGQCWPRLKILKSL